MDERTLVDHVDAALREVADELVMPRGRSLDDGDIFEKNPGDLVTVADREAEAALTSRLASLIRGSVVVGEEAVALNPMCCREVGLPRRSGSSIQSTGPRPWWMAPRISR